MVGFLNRCNVIFTVYDLIADVFSSWCNIAGKCVSI